MAAQSEGLQFYQTRSNAIILYNTLPAVCIERVVNIRSGEELYSKLYQFAELSQRIAFKPNLPYGRQDTTFFWSDSIRRPSQQKAHGNPLRQRVRGGNIDFTIEGLPHSTVQQKDDTRKEAVKQLIHQSETHPNRAALKGRPGKGSSVQTHSARSRRIWSAAWETLSISRCARSLPKYSATIVLTYWTTGIVYFVCGTCLRLSDKHRKLNKDRFDVPSIPNDVIKKGPSHGARHGPPERQRIYYVVNKTARKARKNMYTSRLDRFVNSPCYRDSQTAIGWDEELCAPWQIGAEMKILGSLYWTLFVKNGLMDQRRRLPWEIVWGSWKGQHQTPTPRIKFDNDEVNNLLGPKRVPSGSTPKQVGGGTTSINKFFIFKLAQNSNLRLGMSDMLERTRGVFANRQWRFPCKRREVFCRTPSPHAMSHVIFSRIVSQPACQCLSASLTCTTCAFGSMASRLTMECCARNFLSSHLAQHTQYIFFDYSAIIEHFFASHLHSNPPFNQAINGTSADFIFWRDLPLRRSS